jgi:hypothetical protein
VKRNIEGRLAKLESSTGSGKPGLIFAKTEPGETLEDFEKRVDRLIREATERDGCEPFVFKLILAHEKSTAEARDAVGGQGAQ